MYYCNAPNPHRLNVCVFCSTRCCLRNIVLSIHALVLYLSSGSAPPASFTTVGKTSIRLVGSATSRPGVRRPGQRNIPGTRIPPSQPPMALPPEHKRVSNETESCRFSVNIPPNVCFCVSYRDRFRSSLLLDPLRCGRRGQR